MAKKDLSDLQVPEFMEQRRQQPRRQRSITVKHETVMPPAGTAIAYGSLMGVAMAASFFAAAWVICNLFNLI